MLDALSKALVAAGLPAAVEDLQDILWLAQRLGAAPAVATGSASVPGPAAVPLPPATAPTASAPPTPAPTATAPGTTGVGSTALYAAAHQGHIRAGVLRVPGVTSALLPANLRRALQPFARRVMSTSRWQFDEEETAERRADSGLWQLRYRRPRERWFDLNVVVDSGASMELWQPEIDAFVRGLKGQGGFRSLTAFTLAGSAQARLSRRADGNALPASALAAPGLRPVTLVLTDGGAELWRGGAGQRWLWQAAALTPLSVLQLLPRRAWRHTPLGEPAGATYWPHAGLPNTHLRVLDDELGDAPAEPWRAVPLFGMDPSSVHRWARASTARGGASMPAMWVAADRGAARRSGGAPTTAPERVAHFRGKVSAAAYDLAVFLSVPDPLTVPVMRLVQRTMLPDTGTAELAEFFLGGLLTPLPASGGTASWRLREGVRENLMLSLRYSEEQHIAEQLRRVGQALEQAGTQGQAFEAWFPSPQGSALLSEWALPFATTSRDILQTLEPAVALPPAAVAQVDFLVDEAVSVWVRDSGRLPEDDVPVDRLLIFATPRQQTWIVFTRQTLVLLLDDADTRREGRLVQRITPYAQALPAAASVDAKGSATVGFGRTEGRWYYSPALFATPALLDEAIRLCADAVQRAEAVLQRVQRCTVRFDVMSQDQGCGYAVAPNRVATAAHLVKAWQPGEWQPAMVGAGREARVLRVRVRERDDAQDAALLETDEPLVEHLPLALAVKRGAPWIAWPVLKSLDSAGAVQGMELQGQVRDPAFGAEGQPAGLLLHSAGAAALGTALSSGMAGCPLLVGGAVAGHLLRAASAAAGFLHGCPASVVATLLERAAAAPAYDAGAAGVESAGEAADRALPTALREGVLILHARDDAEWARRLLHQVGTTAKAEALDLQLEDDGDGVTAQARLIDALQHQARAVLVLLSPAYLRSPLWRAVEGPLLELARAGTLRLLWAMTQPCDWAATPYAAYTCLIQPGVPLAGSAASHAESLMRDAAATLVLSCRPAAAKSGEAAEKRGIFMACSPASRETALRLRADLLAVGYSKQVYLDTVDLSPGEPWEQALEEQLQGSALLLLLVGPAGTGDWAQRQMQVANRLRVPIQPLLLDGANDPPADQLGAALAALPLRAGSWFDDFLRLRNVIATRLGEAALPRRIYLASTHSDLTPERDAVIRVAAARGMQMSYADSAGTDTIHQQLRQDIEVCDLLVLLLLGSRNGHVSGHDNPNESSVVELEYRIARELGKPVLAFMKNTEAARRPDDDRLSGENEAGVRIAAFRHRVAQDMAVHAFANVEELIAGLESGLASRSISATQASNAAWQQDLSVKENNIGQLLSAQGDPAGAEQDYRAALAAAEQLALADPNDTQLQGDLSVSQDILGHALSEQGDLAGAEQALRASMAVRERLATADPGNAQLQRDLSLSISRVAELLHRKGDQADAVEMAKRSLAIDERLAALDSRQVR